jgi:hypothetical protein
MPDPQIVAYLRERVWQALRTVSIYLDTLPISEHETRRVHRGIETLTEKFVLISKQRDLHYPNEE